MKWMKLYPKAWRERYEEEFSYVYSKSGLKGFRLAKDLTKHFASVWIDELAFKKGKKMGATTIFIYSFVIYAMVLMLTLFIPASQGYNVVSWKLIIGQVYAVPAFLAVQLLLMFRNKLLKV